MEFEQLNFEQHFNTLKHLALSAGDPAYAIQCTFFSLLWREMGEEKCKKSIEELDGQIQRTWEKNPSDLSPSREDLWAWTKLFPVKTTRVVIIGHDPVLTGNVLTASGLAFESKDPNQPSPSLTQIIELIKNNGSFQLQAQQENINLKASAQNSNYSLKGWTDQGVLLLNCWTSIDREEKSLAMKMVKETNEKVTEDWKLSGRYKKYELETPTHPEWLQLTSALVTGLHHENPNVVFILVGKDVCVKLYEENLLKKENTRMLEDSVIGVEHPAAAFYANDGKPRTRISFDEGLLLCNQRLLQKNLPPIDWLSLDRWRPTE